jgi:hypothetical protein
MSGLTTDLVRRAVATAVSGPVERVDPVGDDAWEAAVAGAPVLVVVEHVTRGVAVLELRQAGPPVLRRPAVAVLGPEQVLPLAEAASYLPLWERLRTAAQQPERLLADLAIRYAGHVDVDTHQILVAELADLADHVDAARARELGVEPLRFNPGSQTWAVWSYGLARSGARPPRLDLLRWRITLDPGHPEIAVVERRSDVPSTFYEPGRRTTR